MEKNRSSKTFEPAFAELKKRGTFVQGWVLQTLAEWSEEVRERLERVIPDSLVVWLLMMLGAVFAVFFGSFFFINGQLGVGLTVIGWAEVIAIGLSFLACFLPWMIIPSKYHRELTLRGANLSQKEGRFNLLTWLSEMTRPSWAQKIIMWLLDSPYILRLVQVAGFLGMSFLLDGDGIGRFTVLGIVGGILW